MEEQTQEIKNIKYWHDKYYKLLLLIPLTLLIFSLIYMGNFYTKNNDFIYKDISLTGGTTVTLHDKINQGEIQIFLEGKLENLNTREISDLITQETKAVIVETTTSAEQTRQVLENYLGYALNEENSSFEFTGSSLSESFYNQLLIAMMFAFILMGIVVFLIFRTFVPSSAVILSVFADILMTLTFINILGIKMSNAGIVAFLMIIAYSVDTDILLTTRLLKRKEGDLNNRIFNAFKTGITMTLSSIVAVISALIIVKSFSVTLSQIFTILSIGLCFDILNTWITNVSILKWYIRRKNDKNN